MPTVYVYIPLFFLCLMVRKDTTNNIASDKTTRTAAATEDRKISNSTLIRRETHFLPEPTTSGLTPDSFVCCIVGGTEEDLGLSPVVDTEVDTQ